MSYFDDEYDSDLEVNEPDQSTHIKRRNLNNPTHQPTDDIDEADTYSDTYDDEDDGVDTSVLAIKGGNNPKDDTRYTISDELDQYQTDDYDPDDYEHNMGGDVDFSSRHFCKINQDTSTMSSLVEMHPERISHGYDEIVKMASVVRDANGIVVDELHKTLPILTKYERARILGQRARQLQDGANSYIPVPENVIDEHIIANMELAAKKLPYIIRRPIPNGGSEYWRLDDLELLI